MKIAHVNNRCRGLHQIVGGAETAMYRTACMARDQGHDPFIVTTRMDVVKPDLDFRYHILRRAEDYLPGPLVKYSEALKYYVWEHDPWASADFRRVLQKENPDIVHFHNLQFPGLHLIQVAHEAGIRTCLTVYDYWLFCPDVMLLDYRDQYCRRFHGSYCVNCLPPIMRTPQRILLSQRKRVFDRYINMVDRWIVLSEHSSTVLQEYGIPKDKIRVVRLTLPLEFESTKPDEGNDVDPDAIFFAGWLQRRKGVHVLLEAMPLILREYPKAKLRIAGHYPRFEWDYKKKLEELMRAPQMKEHVTFLGHLNSRQIEQELRRGAVVAIPEQYENMSPLLMIEAMALGRPLVISRAGGIPEFITEGKSGWMADPRSPVEFAEKIVRILKSEVDIRQVGAEAQKSVMRLCALADVTRMTMTAYNF